MERDEQGRVDPDAEPSWAWLEQVALDSPSLVTRTDDAGRTRDFVVTVRETELQQPLEDIEPDRLTDEVEEEAERLVEEMSEDE